MSDVHEPHIRSYNMSRIRSTDTKPELIVRKFLHKKGLRFRLYDKNLPGKPDIVLPKHKTVIFVNGCFWHGHEGCKHFVIPKTKTEWWLEKINKTVRRDNENIMQLFELGWVPLVVWECELKFEKRHETLIHLYNKALCQYL